MAFKLNKKEAARLQALADAYETAREELSQALEDLASEWESEFEEKSDRWKEGDAGREANERVEAVRGWCDEFPDSFDVDFTALI
jgi:hypothetical protein